MSRTRQECIFEDSSRCPRFINSRACGRILKRGWVSQFFGCPELFVRMPVAVLQPLARAGLWTRRSLLATQCRLAPAADDRRTGSSYHILGYLGQRDEPSSLA